MHLCAVSPKPESEYDLLQEGGSKQQQQQQESASGPDAANTRAKEWHSDENNAFVNNLPFKASEDDIRRHFEGCGTVAGVRIVREQPSGRSKVPSLSNRATCIAKHVWS